MPEYRSKIFQERKMAGARALWRATNNGYDPHKPIIAIANSFTEFVPGHTHLREVGEFISQEILKAGGIPKEFNTIAIDDGIAMGHTGMLYSLPSRELIADTVEYMVNAHRADALICLSNCDKITPAMLMATMRLNIPTIFVSGGPMEAGNCKGKKIDLIDIMAKAGNKNVSEEELKEYENFGCPTCGSCAGMFTANSMNCLCEALGMAMAGNGTLISTHKNRKTLFSTVAHKIVEITKDYYENGNDKVLPLSIATKEAFENAMCLDIAMGGSTNTVLHLLAVANEANVDFTMKDINQLSKKIPTLCKVAPSSSYHVEDVHRAGGIMGIMAELNRKGLINQNCLTISGDKIINVINEYDIMTSDKHIDFYKSAPSNELTLKPYSTNKYYNDLDKDRQNGCIRSVEYAYSINGGLNVLFGNIAKQGAIVKTAGVDKSILKFTGTAIVCESQEEAVDKILDGTVKAGNVVVIRYEGPQGGPGMQEMLYPTTFLKSVGIDKQCALITDGRFSGGTSGLSIGHISPEAMEGGEIALVEDGDVIEIDINNYSMNLAVSDEELEKRRKKLNGIYRPKNRNRIVLNSLKVYASLVDNASKGAVRKKINNF